MSGDIIAQKQSVCKLKLILITSYLTVNKHQIRQLINRPVQPIAKPPPVNNQTLGDRPTYRTIAAFSEAADARLPVLLRTIFTLEHTICGIPKGYVP